MQYAVLLACAHLFVCKNGLQRLGVLVGHQLLDGLYLHGGGLGQLIEQLALRRLCSILSCTASSLSAQAGR